MTVLRNVIEVYFNEIIFYFIIMKIHILYRQEESFLRRLSCATIFLSFYFSWCSRSSKDGVKILHPLLINTLLGRLNGNNSIK